MPKKLLSPNESRRGFIRVDFAPGAKVRVQPVSPSVLPARGKKLATPGAGAVGVATYDALDVSVYGISFLATQKKIAHLEVGQGLVRLEFEVLDRPVCVTGKVVYLHTGLVAGLTKVAVEFTQIEIDDVWHLSRYVAEKANLAHPRDVGEGWLEKARTSPARKKTRPKKKPAASRR